MAGGHGLVAPELTRRLIARFAEVAPPPARERALDKLTARERELLVLLVAGRTNAEIGVGLCIEESTVKRHVTHILQKLGTRNRVEAVVAAYAAGVGRPSEASAEE